MSHIFTYHCNVVSSLDLFNHTNTLYIATYKKHHNIFCVTYNLMNSNAAGANIACCRDFFSEYIKRFAIYWH